MSDQPKRRGRPRIHPTGDLRRNITFQAGGELYRRLEAAAAASGNSLSREVENRLLASFESADLRAIVREEIDAALRPGVMARYAVNAHSEAIRAHVTDKWHLS